MKKQHLLRLAIIYVIAMIYPIYRGISSKSWLPLSDATFFMSLILIVFGLFTHIGRIGAFDSTMYIFMRSFKHYEKTYEAYQQDLKANKKDSFNYPLFLGIMLLVTSIITSLLY